MIRALLRPLVMLAPLITATTPSAADERIPPARQWLHHALEAEAAKPVEAWDWNLIASITFPLARHHQRRGVTATEGVLNGLARRLDGVDSAALGCGELADLYLTERFLEEASIPRRRQAQVDGERQRLAACLAEAPQFDRANALLLACRYGVPLERAFVDRAAAELVAGQTRDGAFTDRGKSGYYLTSHAMLALHECGGHGESVALAAGKLTRHLVPFLRQGFLDGVAESLLFLRWVGHPAADEAALRSAVERWVTTDGGLCFNARPGCEAHWHATALLLELLDGGRGNGGQGSGNRE